MKNLSKWILGNYFQISIFRVIQVKNVGEIKKMNILEVLARMEHERILPDNSDLFQTDI